MKFYRQGNRPKIEALLADIERVSPQLNSQQVDRLRHLTTIATRSYA